MKVIVAAAALILAVQVAPQRPASDERGIYEAVFNSVFKGAVPASFVVPAEVTPWLSPPDSRSSQLAMLPAALRAKLAGYPRDPVRNPDDRHTLESPLSTDDGLDVLVHFGHGCGSLCGSSGYAWLHRRAKDAPWVVRLIIVAVA